MDPDFGTRNVNEGFSGGEKKRHEIVQLELLNPKIAILDETDSGLDIDALRIVSEGVNRFAEQGDKGVLLITHYTRILRYIKPDFVHVFVAGRVAEEGGPELAERARGRGLRPVRCKAGAPSGMTARDRTFTQSRWTLEPVRGGLPDPVARRSRGGLPLVYLDSAQHLAEAAPGGRGDRGPLPAAQRQRGPGDAPARRRGDRGVRGRPGQGRGLHRRAEPGRDRLHQERLRGAQPGCAHTLGADRCSRATRSSSPRWSTTPTSSRGSCSRERTGATLRWFDVTDDGRLDLQQHRRADQRAHQGRLADLRVERARHDQPDQRHRRQGARGRRDRGRGRLAGGAAAPGRRVDARRRPARLHRPQDGRPDRHRRALGPLRPARVAAAVPRRWRDDRGRPDDRLDVRRRRRPGSRPVRRRSPRPSGSVRPSTTCPGSGWTRSRRTSTRSRRTRSRG